jgi:hypothetical protein
MLPKARDSSSAARSPTCRMPRPVHQAPQLVLAAAIDLGDQVVPDFPQLPRARPFRLCFAWRDHQLGELRRLEMVEVGDVVHQALLHELIDDGLAETLDVHRVARREVLDAPPELRGQRLFSQRHTPRLPAARGGSRTTGTPPASSRARTDPRGRDRRPSPPSG